MTRESVHYVRMDSREVPAHETEFARDSVFGYSTSYLPDYVEAKTRGRIPAVRVHRFLLDDVRAGVYPRLMALHGNACVVVDAEHPSDLDRFAADLRAAVGQGKRFLFRSAASLLTALAALPPQPVAPEAMSACVRGRRAGAVLVGSHVSKTTRQLERLLGLPGTAPLEVDVERLPAERATLLAEIVRGPLGRTP